MNIVRLKSTEKRRENKLTGEQGAMEEDIDAEE